MIYTHLLHLAILVSLFILSEIISKISTSYIICRSIYDLHVTIEIIKTWKINFSNVILFFGSWFWIERSTNSAMSFDENLKIGWYRKRFNWGCQLVFIRDHSAVKPPAKKVSTKDTLIFDRFLSSWSSRFLSCFSG